MFIGTQNVRTFALMCIVLMYLIFGAAVFNACNMIDWYFNKIININIFLLLVESKEEIRLRTDYRLRLARILYKNDTIPDETLFIALTTRIFENRHVRNGTAKQWTFPGAFYFSTLVVTLIGKLV